MKSAIFLLQTILLGVLVVLMSGCIKRSSVVDPPPAPAAQTAPASGK